MAERHELESGMPELLFNVAIGNRLKLLSEKDMKRGSG